MVSTVSKTVTRRASGHGSNLSFALFFTPRMRSAWTEYAHFFIMKLFP